MLSKRLTIFVEGETDKLFFSLLISFLFKNANKKQWPNHQLRIISLDGICQAESIIKSEITYLENTDKFRDTICLIHDTDAFEYQKKPPVSIERVKHITEQKGCIFLEIAITHNVEDMIAFSAKEIIEFLKLPKTYIIPKNETGLNILKSMHKAAGEYYVKGHKSENLLKCLNYSSICKKFCLTLKPLCDYFELDCRQNLCRIKTHWEV